MAESAESLDAVNTIPKRLDVLGCTLNFYGKLLGMTSGQVSNIFSQRRRLSAEKSQELSGMLAKFGTSR